MGFPKSIPLYFTAALCTLAGTVGATTAPRHHSVKVEDNGGGRYAQTYAKKRVEYDGPPVPLSRNSHRMRLTLESTINSIQLKSIPFQTIRRPSTSLSVGQNQVLTYGVKGIRQVRTIQHRIEGRPISTSVYTTTVRKPVNEVILYGVPESSPAMNTFRLPASRSGAPADTPVMEAISVVATAYVGGGRTATGWVAGPGVIAVDPSVIPLGSKLYIPGFGVEYAEDTGGSIQGDRIDICMANESQALQFGRRDMTIYILRS